ncbi:MAG: hypothetical protein IKH58_13055 [Bacteroidales bacterium]|jgi:hypothetical protein|nr:hypothetical protein [Bacteroidales bacterium]
MNVSDKAANYAEGKANEFIKKAIAQAYADGYQDGYNDREAEIPVDLRDNKTEYVDLGLPSGTLWAADFEKDCGANIYLPYGKAQNYSIPTEEQWNELKECCEWKYDIERSGFKQVKCIGPNGNYISFERTRMRKANDLDYTDEAAYFWINKEESDNLKSAVKFYGSSNMNGHCEIRYIFSGYQLPIRLVR